MVRDSPFQVLFNPLLALSECRLEVPNSSYSTTHLPSAQHGSNLRTDAAGDISLLLTSEEERLLYSLAGAKPVN
jgi:hypothetical protein